MKKMKLIKSKKMLTVLLTATAAMAVTPMAGYAETVQTKQIVNQSSEATVEVLSGNCGPVDEEGNFTESTKWSLEKNSEAEEFYTLRISGNGRMADFTISNTEDNSVRRHIVGGANRTLFSVDLPPRLCRTGT